MQDTGPCEFADIRLADLPPLARCNIHLTPASPARSTPGTPPLNKQRNPFPGWPIAPCLYAISTPIIYLPVYHVHLQRWPPQQCHRVPGSDGDDTTHAGTDPHVPPAVTAS